MIVDMDFALYQSQYHTYDSNNIISSILSMLNAMFTARLIYMYSPWVWVLGINFIIFMNDINIVTLYPLPVQHQLALAALMGQSNVSAIVYFLTGSYNTQQTTHIVDQIRGYARNIFI